MPLQLLARLHRRCYDRGRLCAYLTGSSDAFPHPLGDDEEADCLQRLHRGEEPARARLIEHNLRLVAHIVKKFDNTGEDTEDLISIGTVGLIKAIGTFDPDKGTRLATYAARCIENEILMYLRARRRTRGEVSLFDPIGVDREGNEITLMDILGTEADLVVDEVGARFEVRHLLRTLQCLSPRERRVIELRYGLGGRRRRTQREIAGDLGISRSYVSRIEKRAVSRLAREMDRRRPQQGSGRE